MQKYGRRYYDRYCRVCVEEKRSVLFFHGVCASCLARRILATEVLSEQHVNKGYENLGKAEDNKQLLV